ncbi:MotA/TolQ/ExbB proton channel family protein [Pseudodesulfovibrio sediminis]|uniref:MotA/TolQ/ExbB proton channel domain-containing protein n=1 Tax=Pseudodesulfovibrio sediminis TaxID=2810563 RepID=A0ABM7P432_9BACT|nr:MotA/TolQ/ExbB proton channel family protein [Pseudodesulfovibrio sediminis]BCS87636.1 hypothetical protein PSDVSF_08780 [Pseudodesulfovibrio sediminis]
MQQLNLVDRMLELFQSGGELMIPLMGLSLIIWTLAIVKGIRFLRERHKETSPQQCMDMYRHKAGVNKAEPAHWQWDILSRYIDERCEDPELNREILKSIRAPHEFNAMCSIGTILILSAVAPLLGLLGTVTGMITTFDVISQFGTGNARALASGISKALITTQSGLVVAVPGLILGGLLFRRGEKLKARMELFCIGLQELTDSLTPGRK